VLLQIVCVPRQRIGRRRRRGIANDLVASLEQAVVSKHFFDRL
jgi:hypothetical protein